MKIKYFLFFILILIILPGCNWLKIIDNVNRDNFLETSPQILANEAEQYLINGDYDKAADFFQLLKERYPYSKYSLLADLRIGDAYFKLKRYDEAVLAYEDFIRLHPKNEAIPYVYYQLGMIYHEQMLAPDRDQTFSREAVNYFQKLIRNYSSSDWAQKAQPRLKDSLERLIQYDLTVGQFYYNTKHYEAAISRFKKILTQYPDIGLYNQAIEGIRIIQRKIELIPEEERKQRQDNRINTLIVPPMIGIPQVILENDRRDGNIF